MTTPKSLARGIATVLLAGPWEIEAMADRMATALRHRRAQKWVRALAERVVGRFDLYSPPPRLRVLCEFLLADAGFQRTTSQMLRRRRVPFAETLALPMPEMTPRAKIGGADSLPRLVTPGRLAAWLGLSPSELDWFADCHSRERTTPPGKLRHYRYQWIAKPSGRRRLVEAPKPRLKLIQRQLLDEILSKILPHSSAHGFVTGRSTVSFAAPHVNQRVLLRIDLRDFFPSIRRERVSALFRTVGFPEAVARLLAGLCTNAVPADELLAGTTAETRADYESVFGRPHLPQGAPTSPALANLCAFRLDCRLSGLARRAGATYTRYADDLLFSGDCEFEKSLPRFRVFVCAILLNEGFSIRRRKTRVMRSGTRQQAAGIVVNHRPNVPREEFDRLKAILHNCRRFGLASQNRNGLTRFREHLQGRVAYAWMVNPARAAKLQEILDGIE